MYYPIQIPYILNDDFSKHILYSEEAVEPISEFVICLWEMNPLSNVQKSIPNIIVADGCIDLVVDYDNKRIGFAGMSKTDFHFVIHAPARFFGARLKPGAFFELTGLPATSAMDNFLSLKAIDSTFDTDAFFSLSLEKAKQHFKNYLERFISGKEPNPFVLLFDKFIKSPPSITMELCTELHFSPRQCQRLFAKQFGITPQMALSILRFQHALEILTSNKAKPSDVLRVANYYDQSHFIKDFKKNIGLTPLEYLQKYK